MKGEVHTRTSPTVHEYVFVLMSPKGRNRKAPYIKTKTMRFLGEIIYPGVHSDIDFNLKGDPKRILTQEDRDKYHALLDEWLDKSGGQGIFYLSNEDHLKKFKD